VTRRNMSWLLVWWCIGISGLMMTCSYAAEPMRMPSTQNVNWGAIPLSPAQKDALRKHDVMWQQAFEQLYPEIVSERKRLRLLLMQPNTDHDAIFRSLQHLEDKEQELRYEAVKNFLLKKQELTPQQREQLLRTTPSPG
jgi:Spy/CpxP family protein refolding chaperone